MQVRSLGGKDALEEDMATHCSILAWRIPWTEETGGLQSQTRTMWLHTVQGLQCRPSQFSGSEVKACTVWADCSKLMGNSASQRHSEAWVSSPPHALASSEPCAFTCLARVHLRVPAGGKGRARGDLSFQPWVRISHLTPWIHNSKKGSGTQSPSRQAGAQPRLCLAAKDAGGRAVLSETVFSSF